MVKYRLTINRDLCIDCGIATGQCPHHARVLARILSKNGDDNGLGIVFSEKLSDQQRITFDKQEKQFLRQLEQYEKNSREWEVTRQEIDETKKDLEKGYVGYEDFSTLRIRRSMALRKIRQELIDFQENLKRKIMPEFNAFIMNLEKVKK